MNRTTAKAAALMTEVRNKVPLVHQITNYVTVNDCANITLAIGASPIMADDISEAADITAISSSLVINIGTLNERTITSMLASGRKANELNIPIIFDPVGAGASRFRDDTTKAILAQLKLSVLRGNLSEVSFVAGHNAITRGVDASTEDSDNDALAVAKEAARQLGCVVAVTGAMDVITDGERTITIHNGHKMLSRVTGTGCMSTALLGSFVGATDDYFSAAVAGITVMGIAGEIACEKACGNGLGSFRTAIIDAVSTLDKNTFESRAKINEI